DGVLEVLDVRYGGTVAWGTFTPSGGQARLRATDTDLAGPVVLGRFRGADPRDGPTYDDEELAVRAAAPGAAPSAVGAGPADDPDGWLWPRRDAARISFEGDPATVSSRRRVLDQPIA